MVYPTTIYAVPSFGTNMSDVKTHTTWRDEITTEVRNIEIELGTSPSATFGTVKLRLEDIEEKITDALCSMRRNGAGITSGAAADAPGLTTDILDPLGWHTSGSATRITPTIAGYYIADYSVVWQADTDYTHLRSFVAKNSNTGTQYGEVRWTGTGTTGAESWCGVTEPIQMDAVSDYFEIYLAQTNTSGALNTVDVTLTVRLVRAT